MSGTPVDARRSANGRGTRRKKILFICGSINQTTQMDQIARELPEYEHFFTPYYGNADFEFLKRIGVLENTIGGHKLSTRCLDYLAERRLPVDYGGYNHPDVDLILHCSDLVYPNNLYGKRVILVQEGMTDPESVLYPIVKRLPILPRWMAGTSATGLTHGYDRFCVASEGFRDLFISRGIRPESLVVTGIPNFDDCARFHEHNDFPHEGFTLCCTSDVREAFWFENRKATIQHARQVANGRKLIFKLHPNERHPRAIEEIRRWAPEALIYRTGSAEQMVAKCAALVCKYSSVAFVGLALGKDVHSFFPIEQMRRLLPLQNKCAAKNIAAVAREVIGDAPPVSASRGPAGAEADGRDVPAQQSA